MIRVEGVTKTYCAGEVETHALRGVSFRIKKGEFVAIMGPSGSGKSTLMHIMSFLDRPTKGQYLFEEQSIDDFDDDGLAKMRNERMGFVFQNFNLLPRTTVFDNVRLPLVYSDEIDEKKVIEAIESVGLSHRTDHHPNQLSGGEKQRVAIARALVNRPSVIFADEPTGNLDSKTGNEIMKILQRLNDEGRTIVMVTHEKSTSEHAERLIILKDGRVEKEVMVKSRVLADNGNELKK